MKVKTILAIDQGTTNTKALLVDSAGVILSRSSRPLRQSFPQPGWAEQDPIAIWHSVQEAIDECLASMPHSELVAIAITNQRETVMLWDRLSGQPLGPCIGWQCRRTVPLCEELRAGGREALLRHRTGLIVNPLFSATKVRWLLDHVEGNRRRAENGEACLGTIDSWVLWNLTGGAVHACDVTNAARTQLFNIHSLQWDEELLALFDVPAALLPQVRLSSEIYGASISTGRLPQGIPIASLIGDSHAALYGQAGFQPGVIKATYGTGSSLMTLTSAPVTSERGLSTTIAWGQPQVKYALEGNIPVTGAAVQWLGEILGLPDPVPDVAELAASTASDEALYFVPAFAGLGAPHWNEAAQGLITGITRGTLPSHLASASIKAIAYQIRDVFDVMQADSGSTVSALLADGGGSSNDLLMQFQADIIGHPVLRSTSPDVAALGAAYLAGLAIGLWSSEAEIATLPRPRDCFEPRKSKSEREMLYAGWQAAVERTVLDTGSDTRRQSPHPGSAREDNIFPMTHKRGECGSLK